MDVLYVFHRWRDDVYRLAAGYTLNPREAEDVSQRVFLKLPEQRELLPGREKAWLMEATVNECRALLRFRWLRGKAAREKTPPASGDPVDETLWLLWKLKPEYREALYLVYFAGLSYRSAGAVMGKSETQITNLVHRGKRSLKQILEREGFTYADE